MVDGVANDADLEMAARIVARYSQGRDTEQVTVEINRINEEPFSIDITPFSADDIHKDWVL